MKTRRKKKLEKLKRDQIHKVLDLVLDINGLEPRRQELTGDKPSVFFDFSGHVARTSVSIHRKGYRNYEPAEWLTKIGGDSITDLGPVIKKLEEIKKAPREQQLHRGAYTTKRDFSIKDFSEDCKHEKVGT